MPEGSVVGMDSLSIIGLAMLAAVAVAITSAASAGYRLELAPVLAHRRILATLRADVQILADEHAARPEPRRRHSAHCPACGRFATVAAAGPRGTWTRCKAHGIRLRAVKRIGERERNLVAVTRYRPLVGAIPALPMLEHVPLVGMLDAIRPWRPADWLDGNAERDDFRRDMMRPVAA